YERILAFQPRRSGDVPADDIGEIGVHRLLSANRQANAKGGVRVKCWRWSGRRRVLRDHARELVSGLRRQRKPRRVGKELSAFNQRANDFFPERSLRFFDRRRFQTVGELHRRVVDRLEVDIDDPAAVRSAQISRLVSLGLPAARSRRNISMSLLSVSAANRSTATPRAYSACANFIAPPLSI